MLDYILNNVPFIYDVKQSDKYIYILDCIKCILQEALLSNIRNDNIDDYKEFIIKYGKDLNPIIMKKFDAFVNILKNDPNIIIAKRFTIDSIYIESYYKPDIIIQQLKDILPYKMRIYHIKILIPGFVDYNMYVM